ncbi:MAG TPA: hypothetical protein PKZ56_01035 [Candidatus Paceibacterota bacterium]|nr:hypothetical protein [Candidatus Paceibacterota bacterium]
MKWNDIKKHFARTNNQQSDATTIVTDEKLSSTHRAHHRIAHWILLILITCVVAIGIIALIKVLSGKQVTPVLPVQELKNISTFLDQNPPKPLNESESAMVSGIINKPVQLDDEDMKAINNFLKK